MKKFTFILLAVVLIPKISFCQYNDSNYISTLSNPRNITVATYDGETYTGMAIDISIDFIVMDIKSKRHLLVKTPYYLRPAGKYYRIDVEYLRTMYTKKRRRVVRSALYSGLSGMVVAGTGIYYQLNHNADINNKLGNYLAFSAAGFVIGTLVGTVTVMAIHKKWLINGSSEKLAEFRDYYF